MQIICSLHVRLMWRLGTTNWEEYSKPKHTIFLPYNTNYEKHCWFWTFTPLMLFSKRKKKWFFFFFTRLQKMVNFKIREHSKIIPSLSTCSEVSSNL